MTLSSTVEGEDILHGGRLPTLVDGYCRFSIGLLLLLQMNKQDSSLSAPDSPSALWTLS
jgi:hypothetical protein